MQGSLHHLRCSAEGGLASLAAWPIFQRPKPVLRTILTEVHRAGPGTYCGRLSSRFETDWAWLQRLNRTRLVQLSQNGFRLYNTCDGLMRRRAINLDGAGNTFHRMIVSGCKRV